MTPSADPEKVKSRREFLRDAALAAGGAGLAGCATRRKRDGACLLEEGGIWDLHGHLAGVPGDTPAERMKWLVGVMDRMGIERIMMFLGMRFSGQNPDPKQIVIDNDECLRAIESRPDRSFGFVYLNPNHVDFSLRELNRCVRDGPMVGVKLWTARRCREEELDPIIRRAAELKAVIYQHTWLKVGGNHPGESVPSDVAELARRHPHAPLICGHSGGDWERGIRAIREVPKVPIGLGGFDPCSGIVEMGVSELGPERLIYGSDVGGRSFASQLSKVIGAAIPTKNKRLILRENLRRMLLPILRAKGIHA